MGHTSFQFDRRTLLKSGVASAGALALGPSFFMRAFAHGPVKVGRSPYGPLQPFDSNGIALPKGFRSREIARGGVPVAGSSSPYPYHFATDGQATYPTLGADGAPDGGWILAANSEVPIPRAGGASAIEFDKRGNIERAYRILEGTQQNCAGGPTPWGKWLSCEEHDAGQVWECDPTGANPAVARPAMGVFSHEAACVDPGEERIYLTEDEGNGCLYRFTPRDYPDLSDGLLEVAVGSGARLEWVEVPDPSASSTPTREQVRGARRFDGGEGTWFDFGIVYFTTKGDNRVWAYHVRSQRIEVLYDKQKLGSRAPLSGVDNITVSQSGDIYVCEDGADMDICIVTAGFDVARFCKLDKNVHGGPAEPSPVAGNETVGVVFDPAGERMYFGAQRSFPIGPPTGIPRGVVYEVRGPFRKAAPVRFPVNRVKAPRRIEIPKYRRDGLPVRLSLDELVGVGAELRVWRRTPAGRRRPVKIGGAVAETALRGRTALRVRGGKRARALLRGKRRVKAELVVKIRSPYGRRQAVRRDVLLVSPRG